MQKIKVNYLQVCVICASVGLCMCVCVCAGVYIYCVQVRTVNSEHAVWTDMLHLLRHSDVPTLVGWYDFHLLLCILCYPSEGGTETRCALVPKEPQ